jgi:hypothetical protein
LQADDSANDSPWWQQQRLQAPVGADEGVPQRVLPSQYAYADEPVETPEQQAAIVQFLHSMIDASSSCEASEAGEGACVVNNNTNSSTQGQPPQQQQLPATRLTPTPPAAAINKPGAAYSGPDSQVTRKLTFIANSRIKLGLDMDRAGVVSWLSSPLAPGVWKDRNLLNIWDQGRLLQQSFYGEGCACHWLNKLLVMLDTRPPVKSNHGSCLAIVQCSMQHMRSSSGFAGSDAQLSAES